MPTIELETKIKSSIDLCFDLSRSIDLHKISTAQTNERAIDGTTTGLINPDEYVTWEATHFSIRQQLSSKITALNKLFHFRDEQIKGAFSSILHEHYFEQEGDYTIMKDTFHFESPFGVFGRLFNKLILTKYLTKLLMERNQIIKEYAESDKWKTLLKT